MRPLSLSFFAFVAIVHGACATSAPAAAGKQSYRVQFSICGAGKRYNCVVDGDTFWIEGRKVRIADIDAPEVSQPQCEAERKLGERATSRLLHILNSGPFELRHSGGRDADQYGRLLRVPVRNGERLSDTLVRDGLAQVWKGRKAVWC